MKLKVSILTATVLCAILFCLDSFIYVTLHRHWLTLESSVVTNKAQTVAQGLFRLDELLIWPNASQMIYQRLVGFEQIGQGILVFDVQGNLIAQVGKIPTATFAEAVDQSEVGHTRIFRNNNNWYMVTAVPVIDHGSHLSGFVLLTDDIDSIEANLHTLMTALVLGSLGAILLAAAGGYAISSAAVRPIDQMIRLVSRIQANQMEERLPQPRGRDEVARLATTFNQMLDRVEQSFNQQARFVADASHEIRTPLTTIQGYADLLERWGKDNPAVLDKAIQVIRKEAVRLRNLTNDMLTLADLESSYQLLPRSADVTQMVRELVEAQAPLHPELTITAEVKEGFLVAMAPDHLNRILTNLVDNAIKYTPAGGRIRVALEPVGTRVKVTVFDTGQGIPSEDLPHIFDRFYRVDKARSRTQGGNGLGLAIVKELITLHGGEISAESKEGEGTTITFTLPLYHDPEAV